MARHLIFGVPATLALVAIGIIALRRTERLQQEMSRREATEQALRQAQKMEAVGRLTGGIAHDFNNILTVILGNIDMALRRGGDDNPTHPAPARIRAPGLASAPPSWCSACWRSPASIRRRSRRSTSTGWCRACRSCCAGPSARRSPSKPCSRGGLWKVAVDANQLENAILNLAVNARDAMPDGGRLTIETVQLLSRRSLCRGQQRRTCAGQYVMLAVTDSGTGMSREVMRARVRAVLHHQAAGMGTGLGLSMVYGFVKQSSGHIKIYSEPGEGTTIKLYFPRLAEQRGLPDWSDERASTRPAPAARGSETILLVEDDEEVRKFAAEVLREHGYNLHVASDGASALRLLDAESNISLLFTDVVLPGGMNGRQLADEAQRRRPALKVLYATGYTRNAIIHQGRLDADVELLDQAIHRRGAGAQGSPDSRTRSRAWFRPTRRSDCGMRMNHENVPIWWIAVSQKFQQRRSSVGFGHCDAVCNVRNQFAADGFGCGGRKEQSCPQLPSAPCSGPPRKAGPLRCHEPLHRRLLQLRGNLHGLRRRLPVRARRVASGRMHPPQSRLRRGVQCHRQHHGALQQGRPPPAARGAIGELHRVLPRLRGRMRRPRRHAPALRCLLGACTACADACTFMLSTMRMPA